MESFFNTWFYIGLMVLACVVVASRALLVPRERPAWTAFTAALVSWTFAEIWWVTVHPESYPSLADVGYLGFYPLVYLGIVALVRTRARSIGGTLWLDGLMASLAAATLAAAVLVEVVLHSTEGSTSTVVTNLAYPLGDLLLLSAVFGVFSLTRWRPGRRWLLLGLGVLATAIADAIYLFQSAAEDVRRGIVARHPVAGGAAPDRLVRLGGRPEPTRTGGQDALRRPVRLRRSRHRRPGLRPLRPGQPARRGTRDRDSARGRRAARDDLPRESPAVRAHAARVGHRRVDRPRQSPEAPVRSRTPLRGARSRAHPADDLRPRRVQGVQRHVRPPRRRRPPGPPRLEARGGPDRGATARTGWAATSSAWSCPWSKARPSR